MWEKIKANSHYIYFGVIVVGYFIYVFTIYGIDDIFFGYFSSRADYKSEGWGGTYYVYDIIIFMPLFGIGYILLKLYERESKYFLPVIQILTILLVVFLIYLRKNL